MPGNDPEMFQLVAPASPNPEETLVMKLLEHDPQTDNRTGSNPRGLDILTEKSRSQGSNFIIVGTTLVASTIPMLEDEQLLRHARGRADMSREPMLTDLFLPPVSQDDIGLLRGNSRRNVIHILFEIPDDCAMRPQDDDPYIPAAAGYVRIPTAAY